MGKRELEVLLEELLDVGAADGVGLLDLDNLEDMDGAEAGTVTSSHVLVEGLNSLGPAHLTELLVHVVGTGARVVAEPDTEVLDLERALLVDHVEADDLTVGLLDLTELGQEVPEARLGHNGVGREDAHAVQLGRGVSLGGQVTPDDLVLGETPCETHPSVTVRSSISDSNRKASSIVALIPVRTSSSMARVFRSGS